MIDLLLDIATLDDTRLRRRVLNFLFALILPILFLRLSVVWASILALFWLSGLSSDLVAAWLKCGASVLFAIAALLALRCGRRRRCSFREPLLDRPGESGGGNSDDLLAIALIIANHLDSHLGRKA